MDRTVCRICCNVAASFRNVTKIKIILSKHIWDYVYYILVIYHFGNCQIFLGDVTD